MSFQCNDGIITIDVEINQHYKLLLGPEILHQRHEVTWENIRVQVVHYAEIVRLKK